MTDPEKATIGDLFRLMTEMRNEHGAKLDAHTTELAEIRTDMTSVKEDVASIKETVEAHTGELEAIRNVVDNDLAGQGQVIQLDGKLTDVHKTMRQIARELRGTTSRIDRAGIPA